MQNFGSVFRALVVGGSLALGLLPAAAVAQSAGVQAPEVVEAPWQEAISGQIEAFRNGDAPGALSYAGASFQVAFPDAQAFFAAIATSGYAPILESRSHSFGVFQMMGTAGAIQEVRFVGKDQDLYTAVYQMTLEDAGWRVQGVQLVRQPGIAI